MGPRLTNSTSPSPKIAAPRGAVFKAMNQSRVCICNLVWPIVSLQAIRSSVLIRLVYEGRNPRSRWSGQFARSVHSQQQIAAPKLPLLADLIRRNERKNWWTNESTKAFPEQGIDERKIG